MRCTPLQMPKKTIRLHHITREEFDAWFCLDSPGLYLAKEAAAAGEAYTALETLEVLCLVNQLCEIELTTRLAEELAPVGKTQEFIHAYGTGSDVELAVRTLGKKRLAVIFREVVDEVRRLAKLGTGENEQKKPK